MPKGKTSEHAHKEPNGRRLRCLSVIPCDRSLTLRPSLGTYRSRLSPARSAHLWMRRPAYRRWPSRGPLMVSASPAGSPSGPFVALTCRKFFLSVNPESKNLALVFLKTVSHAPFTMKPAAFRHANEGVLFTADGHKAYLRGEKPKLLWTEANRGNLEPTRSYRIGILADDVMEDAVLMFYRLRPTESP